MSSFRDTPFVQYECGEWHVTALATATDSIRAIAPARYATLKPRFYKVGQAPNGNYNFGVYYIPNMNDLRFQNTGNYPANFVKIIDTLQLALDPGSIEVLASSHPVSWSLRRENVLEFLFNNINLPDSTSDEPNSNGFVKFSLRPRANLPVDATISNQAQIYFDYNSPVETNTVSNIFDFQSATTELEVAVLQIFLNPSTSMFNIVRPIDQVPCSRCMLRKRNWCG